jgi:hypothetical protein
MKKHSCYGTRPIALSSISMFFSRRILGDGLIEKSTRPIELRSTRSFSFRSFTARAGTKTPMDLDNKYASNVMDEIIVADEIGQVEPLMLVDVFTCFFSFQLRKATTIFTPMVCMSAEFGRWPTKMTRKISRGGQLHMYARASQAGRSHNYYMLARRVGKKKALPIVRRR